MSNYSSMDMNVSYTSSSNGRSRVSAAEARRLQEQRLQNFSADTGNNLYPRLWDRASAQYYTQNYTQQPAQYNNGQVNDRSNASRGA